MNKEVTIIIPTFNRSHLVCHAIDSALSQTVPCKVIVCDHGSSDDTPDVMKKYGEKIFYIRRERDFGPHFCWLEGVLHAETDLVHIHYDDDLMEQTFIEETTPLMNEEVGFVFTDAKLVDLDKNVVMRENCYGFSRQFSTGVYRTSAIERQLSSKLMLSPALCLYRKQDVIDALYQGKLPIKEANYYHGVGPDHFISLLVLLRYKKFGIVPKPLCVCGAHEGSITMNAATDVENDRRLQLGYTSVRDYYRILKFANFLLVPTINNSRHMLQRLKKIVKKCLYRQ